MPDQEQEYQYDLFLSHASEDKDWCEMLAESLRNRGVRVWFDKWELQPGDNLLPRINEGIKGSRKMVAVFSRSYFKHSKIWTRAESYAQQSPDILSKERPLIPVLIEDCEIEPTLRGILFLDFRNSDDFDLRLRQLIESLDLPRREFAREEDIEFREHKLDPAVWGRRNYAKGKRFEDEIATLYRLLGFETKQDIELSGVQIDLAIQQKTGGMTTQAIVKCKDKRITSAERDQILAQQNLAQRKLPRHRWIAVSSQGFAADTRGALEEAGVDCVTYAELLRDLVPLDDYVARLIEDYDQWRIDTWKGDDWFVRPDLRQDITGDDYKALKYFSDWLGNSSKNQLVILGDVGSGKSTLIRFLIYHLAQNYLKDPVRHPAPVLIPLGEVRKETTLESIVHEHFSRRSLPVANFRRFEHLARQGKIILFFDALDEMADRVSYEDGFSNFREISRAAEAAGKVIVTCRVTYFKDVDEQREMIDEAYRAPGTPFYEKLRERSGNEVVYLKPFDETKIRSYLAMARAKPDEDWAKIEQIYDLKGLAQLPLLLTMITDSLDEFAPGEKVDAAKLYERYTDKWITRDFSKGRVILNRNAKLKLMLELAWRIWNNPDSPMRYRELASFVDEMREAGVAEFRGHETEDIVAAIHLRSFLKREGENGFSFIHRSFMEYFLARRLFNGLTGPEDVRIELLNTRRFNKRIIHFLTMIDRDDSIVPLLNAILSGSYQHNISENALEILYWGGRIHCEMEEEVKDAAELRQALYKRLPRRALLAGANLQGATLECADLTEADLTGADLTKANLNHARLDRAILREATLAEASLEHVSACDADFRQADLSLALFNRSDLTGSDFRETKNLRLESFVATVVTQAKGLSILAKLDVHKLQPVIQLGANSGVNAIAVSPDEELIAAGSGDGVIRLYRTSDGSLLRSLDAHSSSVSSVAFAPDGLTLASGSSDKSVKLWQVDSGKLLRSLDAHSSSVRSVAFPLCQYPLRHFPRIV